MQRVIRWRLMFFILCCTNNFSLCAMGGAFRRILTQNIAQALGRCAIQLSNTMLHNTAREADHKKDVSMKREADGEGQVEPISFEQLPEEEQAALLALVLAAQDKHQKER